jgi:hypothetical protein
MQWPAIQSTHSVDSEIAENTASSTRLDTAVLNLRRTSVGVHLRQLKLSLSADSAREGSIADHVAESLAIARNEKKKSANESQFNVKLYSNAYTSPV